MVKGWVAACLVLLSVAALAAEPVLQIDVGGEKRSFTRDALLAMPAATTVGVAKDATYGGPTTYGAVPIAALLEGLSFPPGSVIEAVATDGFAAQFPLNPVLNTDAGKSMAWLAIEPADSRRPPRAGLRLRSTPACPQTIRSAPGSVVRGAMHAVP